MIKILFLAAIPSDTTRLRLGDEIRAIDEKLRQTEFRDKFEILQHWAVRITDLQSCFLRHKPTIVHFSGHGSEASEIILEDEYGNSKPVSKSALSKLFSIFKDSIRCVVFNACYSEQQAPAIAKHIDCVIGMSKAISNFAAISFSASFYQALGYGKDVETAFELGCGQIDLEDLNEQDIPRLIAINSNPKEIVFIKELSIPDRISNTNMDDKPNSRMRNNREIYVMGNYFEQITGHANVSIINVDRAKLVQTVTPLSPKEHISKLFPLMTKELYNLSLPEDIRDKIANEIRGAEIQIKRKPPNKKSMVRKLKNAAVALKALKELGKEANDLCNIINKAIEWGG